MNSVLQWDVTPLRRLGVRLRAPELAAPVRGVLTMGDDPNGSATSFRRAVRSARLESPELYGVARQALLPPLFEPTLVRIDGGVIVISGLELHGADGRCAEHGQVWRCAPVLGEKL